MLLERGTGISLWRQIQTILETELDEGLLPPGEKLPTEKEYSERFEVNRHTVRRALAALEAKGLVKIEHGRGAFVQSGVISYSLARRVRFSQNLLSQSKSPGGRLLTASVIKAPAEVAAALRLAPGERCSRLELLGDADGAPLILGASYFPHARFPGLIEAYRETGSITAALKRLGAMDYVRQNTSITARMPTSREARLLNQPRTKPVLVVDSVNVDLDGNPVESGQARWAAERVRMIVESHEFPLPL
jgi:GntR family transcriptional regulator, phosphonate transport system regulatory protein